MGFELVKAWLLESVEIKGAGFSQSLRGYAERLTNYLVVDWRIISFGGMEIWLVKSACRYISTTLSMMSLQQRLTEVRVGDERSTQGVS